MSIRAISTAESINAVNKVKSTVRNIGLCLSFKPSMESDAKKVYMQSGEFLNDPHNIKMFDLGAKLAEYDSMLQKEDRIIVGEEENKINKNIIINEINKLIKQISKASKDARKIFNQNV